jgi:hypothetical protein
MNYSIDWDGPGERDREPNWRGLPGLWQAIVDHTQGELFWIGEFLLSELEKETGFRGTPSITGGPDAVRMEFVDRISGTVDPGPPQTPEGYQLVPIVPTERMLEELAHIGEGPLISGAEVWGYMLAAASAESGS